MWIKNKDFFSQDVKLNLDRHQSHKTFCGGLISINMTFLVGFLLILELDKWYTFNGDEYNTFTNLNEESL